MNSFGTNFRVELFGESHGPAIGVIIDGVPPGILLEPSHFKEDLNRRSGGKKGTTPRVEEDSLEFLSGLYNGHTTGTPLSIIVRNNNIRSTDYEPLKEYLRPGHADFTSLKKYRGYADPRGGGHSSGRVTLALVIAGVIAKKIISPISIESKILSIGGSTQWEPLLEEVIAAGDSLGGVIECVATNMPAGLGSPFFDSIESLLSHLLFSIPGIRGVEFGDGFSAASMRGSQHNDPITDIKGTTSRNGAGGVNGGISNGNPLIFKVAVKPTSSISAPQKTINITTQKVEEFSIKGRHDHSFALRVPVIVEAATAIVLANLVLSNN